MLTEESLRHEPLVRETGHTDVLGKAFSLSLTGPRPGSKRSHDLKRRGEGKKGLG